VKVAVKLAVSVFGIRSCYEIYMCDVFTFDTYFNNIIFLQNGENRNVDLKLNRNNLKSLNINLEISFLKYRHVCVFRHWLW
jgi:hypothetical protein